MLAFLSYTMLLAVMTKFIYYYFDIMQGLAAGQPISQGASIFIDNSRYQFTTGLYLAYASFTLFMVSLGFFLISRHKKRQ